MSITNETSSFQRLKRFIYKIVNMTILAKIILFVSDILKNAIDFDIIPHGKVGWFHVTFFILEHNVDYVVIALAAARAVSGFCFKKGLTEKFKRMNVWYQYISVDRKS